jgi:hypothetical protein
MSPREIHIAIDLGLQKLGSFAYGNIKEEYIDYVFNRMGDAYITEKTTRDLDPKKIGFEDVQSRLATIKELVTETDLTVLEDTALKRQSAVLPHNFLSFVEAEAETAFTCDDSTITYTTTASNEYTSVISFKVSDFDDVTTPFSATKVYKVIDTVETEIFDFADYATQLDDIEEIFTVVNIIVQEINRSQTNIKVYWEQYRDLYHPRSFIFVADSTLAGQSMKINYTATANTTVAFTSNAYTKFLAVTSTDYDEKDTYCRLLSNEETYHMLNHPFGTTSPESPIINIVDDKVIAYINERFILKGLTLKYIRKPRRLNLPLNQSYELKDSRAIAKIIDMSVEYLAAAIESQGLQGLIIENQQRD